MTSKQWTEVIKWFEVNGNKHNTKGPKKFEIFFLDFGSFFGVPFFKVPHYY